MKNMRTRSATGTRRWLTTAAGLAALITVTAACGSSSKSSTGGSTATTAGKVQCQSGSISAAGSTFVQNITQQWIKDYEGACSGATVNYQGVGSGAGVQQFIAGTVDFGASDFALAASDVTAAQAKGGTVVQVPWAAGGIAVEYHLSGVTNLKLSPDTLASIFAGKITKWNDAAIKADNAGATLPSSGITVVHRSDGSGTSYGQQGYLSAVSPSIWTYGTSKDWKSPAGQGAKGSDQVTATVKQTEGAIGYAELSFAEGSGLSVAAIKNGAGQFVQPNTNSVKSALATATVADNGVTTLDYKSTDPAAYPISIVTYVISFQKPSDTAKAKLIQSFLTYAITNGQDSAEGLFYTPLPSTIAAKDATLVNSIQTS